MNNFKKTAITVALTSALLMTGCTNTETKNFQEYLKNGDYVKAANYYTKNKSSIEIDNLSETIISEAESIFDEFKNGNITLTAASANLEALLSIAPDDAKELLNEKLETLSLVEESQEQFQIAEECFNSKNYSDAIVYYSKVIEDDPLYASAQEKMQKSKEVFESAIIDKAQGYIDSGNYSEAISLMKSSMDKFSDANKAKSKLSEYESKYKESLLKTANEYAEKGDYYGASNYLLGYVDIFSDKSDIQRKIDEYNEKYIDSKLDELLEETNTYIDQGDYYDAIVSLNEVLTEYPNSEKLLDLQTDLETQFIKKQTDLIDKYISEENYTDAYSVCKNAMELLPDSNELKTRMETIEPLKPVLLSDVKISESAEFSQLTDHATTYEDVVGNLYNPGNLFRIHLYHDGWGGDADGYAKIYLNAQYITLSGTITLDNGSDTGACVLNIIADDQILYSGTFDRTTPPQKVSVDVTGKQWLEFNISYPGENYGYKSDILLAGFGLSK